MDFAGRRARFAEALLEHEIDLFFCPPSGDLEYLTGFPRRAASFGYSEYGAPVRPQGRSSGRAGSRLLVLQGVVRLQPAPPASMGEVI